MPEFENDDLLTNAFAEFGSEVSAYVKPAGTTATRATVQHRRKVRTIAAGALAALAIVTPVAAYAAIGTDSNGPPATPAVSVSAVETTTTPPSAVPTTAASATPNAPDGRISKTDLGKATLTIPAWPKGFDDDCPTGAVKFSGGKAGGLGILALQGDPAYVDVDHDGAQETVAVISCSPQGSDYKALAYDRDATGKIVLVGQVLGSAGSQGKEGTDIETIWSVKAGDNGQVQVDVGEYRPCCDSAQASQHQWRTYGWNGTAFTQTGGPTAFGPNPNIVDVTTTVEKLTLTPAGTDTREGTLKVTVHNNSQFATPGHLRVAVGVPDSWTVQALSGCTIDTYRKLGQCIGGSIPAGGTKVLTVKVIAPIESNLSESTVWVGAQDDKGSDYPNRKTDISVKFQIIQG